tara:strand:+ start:1740 stop:2561 length:822 start_codon:yes stop_codon:yes gene_type:complete
MIIYTCLTNNYVSLPTHMPAGPLYVCFGVQDPPDPWVGGLLPDLDDPIRTSRYAKILCPFQQDSVYVDASKLHLLNDSFIGLSEEILKQYDFFVMQHPHKHTYLEECAEYVMNGWVDEDTIIKFTEEVKETGFDFSKFFSPLCTILWRKKSTPMDKLWWNWYNKGGIRDQLSFSVALQLSKIKFDFEPARDLLNNFTNAEPDGIWWNNRAGDYTYAEKKNPDELVNKLCEITGLSKRMRYRAAREKRTNQIILGDRSKYFTKNDPVLEVLSGF